MIGLACVTLPVLASGRLHLTRRAAPYVLAAGVLEIGGYLAYIVGARDGVAIPAVLASQYAVVAVVGGLLVFRERLSPLQAAGVALTMAGVGTLAAAQA
jgi:drug/metabolite transporter (DMT)-like permease